MIVSNGKNSGSCEKSIQHYDLLFFSYTLSRVKVFSFPCLALNAECDLIAWKKNNPRKNTVIKFLYGIKFG